MNKAVNLLQQYISDGQLEKALIECKKIVQNNINEIYPLKLLAHIYFLKEEYGEAIDTTLKILKKEPNDFDSYNNLGNYYLKLEEFKIALSYIEKAKEINPKHPAPYQNHSEILMKQRSFKDAAELLDRCIKLHETYSNDYLTYKSTLLIRIEIFIAQKKQPDAINFIKKYLAAKFDAELLLNLIQIDRKAVPDELIMLCKEKIKNKSFSSKMEKYQELVPLHFSLATFYEKTNPKLADSFFISANNEVFEIQRLSMLKFQRSILRIMDHYKIVSDFNSKNQKKGANNIFIVGMPRSGTTLTESLISANTEVFGGGELMSFYDLSYRVMIEQKNNSNSFENIGEQYNSRVNFLMSGMDKIADKLPNNYHFMGHIRKFLPAAKIILILRDPWDLCVSLYKQRYVSNIAFTSSFFNIGVQMANFEASILFWQKEGIFDNNVVTIKYENLVEDFDNWQKKLYDFCQINSAYMPEKRERFFAKTASINQVQSKVHSDSLKKDNFSESKAEFIDAFYSQREFWKSKNIVDIPEKYFGYSI